MPRTRLRRGARTALPSAVFTEGGRAACRPPSKWLNGALRTWPCLVWFAAVILAAELEISVKLGLVVAVVISGILPVGPVVARPGASPDHGPGERVVQNFAHTLPSIPGKSLIAVEVNYAPGGKSLPHRHASSAFIYGYVVSGSIRSQVAGGPVRVFNAGESFYEAPGAHHVLGENASKTLPAKLLAVFVVDTAHGPLTISDKQGRSR